MELKEVVGEELFKQIEGKLNGHTVIVAAKDEKYVKLDDNWIPKHRFNELVEQKNTYKESNEELNKQLNLLKEKSKGNDEVQKQIENLQKELTDRDEKVVYITKEFALKDSLRSAGVRYPDLVMATFDIGSVELDTDGKIKEWDNALKELKKDYPDLFGKPNVASTDNGGTGDPPTDKVLTEAQKKEAYEKFPSLSKEKAEEYWYDVLVKTGKIKKG
jgi:hypothetical protein